MSEGPPFEKVLIANRGEIAVRVIRACRELGIRSVAVYSDADRNALHVRYADEAYACGPPAAAKSYLDMDRILSIAKRSGAQAIHPGYGFMSENAEFARRCAEAGVVFIGPSPETIEEMGDKVLARQKMQAAGVPLVPGTTEKLTDDEAIAAAKEMGLPVMVKATAGGGGKGMRLVEAESDLAQSIARARSEARASFGDDAIYVEKFVEQPRHIEIQILGDSHGNAIHLFERECSIQRRHQKVIEEAPANRMPARLREEMGKAAVAAAKAVGYEGAGTCEFLVDARDRFYFLEMNTRVQVEHPVTELITNVDIVKTGIRIAAGQEIGFAQSEVGINGAALECRIYAEDPEQNFRPSPGEVLVYRPPGGPGVRNDSGVYSGAEVTVHYDPMISKLITWGRDRDEAISRMRRALREFVVKGIKTSIPFHRAVMDNSTFLEGRYDTSFIEREILPSGATSVAVDEEELRAGVMLAAIAALKRDQDLAARAAQGGGQRQTESRWKLAGRMRQLRGAG
ncbi:MAG: acetyl-CoA carboxylase biotin carboxylase subunit [Deltaproteobacteria bacterium]|nr:acetyl-CoA carboxylase biotin carboxylase subunit [Deltaproteobacteria bacterium]MBW2414607.1 acetyl-CoA carboxylase biotin carboxylase subunit [Deltaproteobacteria bacterium]